MADDFTQVSCSLDLQTAATVDAALFLFEEMRPGEEQFDGLQAAADPAAPGSLFICDVDGYGDPDQVIASVLVCTERLGLARRWGLCWALTCSRDRIVDVDGGAQVIDLATRRSLGWIDCEHWVSQVIASGKLPDASPAVRREADGAVAG